MLHEGTVRASRSLREDFATTLRQAGFKRSSRLLREGFAGAQRGVAFAPAPRRLRGDIISEASRTLYSKPSWTLQMGSTKNLEPVRTAKDNFHRQRLVWCLAPPRTLRGGLRTLRGGCTYRRLHEDALEGSRGLGYTILRATILIYNIGT